jgi:hypothetical protein
LRVSRMKGSSNSSAMAASPRIMPRFKGMQEARDSNPPSSAGQRHNWKAQAPSTAARAQQRGGTMYFPVGRTGLG